MPAERETVVLVEEIHAMWRDATAGRPPTPARLWGAYGVAVSVDAQLAGIRLLAASGASRDEVEVLRRHRDAARKRKGRAT